jgi:hypothetical protein
MSPPHDPVWDPVWRWALGPPDRAAYLAARIAVRIEIIRLEAELAEYAEPIPLPTQLAREYREAEAEAVLRTDAPYGDDGGPY